METSGICGCLPDVHLKQRALDAPTGLAPVLAYTVPPVVKPLPGIYRWPALLTGNECDPGGSGPVFKFVPLPKLTSALEMAEIILKPSIC